MKLEDWLDTLNVELLIKRYPMQENRYSAWFGVFTGELSFTSGDIKDSVDDPFISGTYGNGTSPREAVLDFLDKVGGKVLVLKPYQEDRRQHIIPKNLEY